MCLLHIGRVSDMNSSLLITFLLGLAGVVVIWMGVATLSLGAVTVGRDYVFTAPGVSRLGPRRGRRIMETPFTYQGLQVPLQRVLTPDRPTLLVFLANLGRDEQVCETLIPSLLQFVRFSEEGIKVVVFCTSASERIAQLVAADSNITVVALTDERLTTALGLFLQVKDFKPLSRPFLQLLSQPDSCHVAQTHEAHGVATAVCGSKRLVEVRRICCYAPFATPSGGNAGT